jgi:uncharacterized membrane protein YfcA
MDAGLLTLLVGAVFAVALLYSSVGHAGASGYIAVMSLAGLAPEEIRPTALVLNVLVASIASVQFRRAGHFSWRMFWPFALLAVPMAFVGGALALPTPAFRVLVGLVLLASAANLLLRPPPDASDAPPARPVALAVGAVLGLFAGLTGTGGGIFLTPLLLLMRWARTKTAAAVSALFILVNSVAGLAGNVATTRELPGLALPLAGAVLVGGFTGSWFGSRRLPPLTLKRLLAAVLVIAGGKLVLGR